MNYAKRFREICKFGKIDIFLRTHITWCDGQTKEIKKNTNT